MSSSASVLYDAPGPRARLRNAVLSVVGTLVLLGLLVVVVLRLAAEGEFDGEVWDIFNYAGIRQNILEGLLATLKVFALAGVFSLVLAVLLCVGRLSDRKAVSRLCAGFIDLFRSIPLLITVFALWVGVIGHMTPMWALVIGLAVYNGCVQAEVLRAGVLAVPKGQREAAYALGLTKTQVMTTVLMPQAVRSMLPSIISQLVVTLKDTSLGYIILYPELLQTARLIASNTQVNGVYPYVPTIIVIGAVYIVLCLALSSLATWIEKRGRRTKTGVAVAEAGEPGAQPGIPGQATKQAAADGASKMPDKPGT